ncbi:Crp/Fnr family transcriptional regulator [Agaribacter marinus]|uniref:cAMP-binding protein n=1 Tax=Agaribacter marinus TaxID=1431249 RepID=A0AA37WJQ1_9ALTE|nr:Crp/Fnr family transcriptional regulator [Agaribacter marinus]GLR70444.1 cAMP-binding protein [Agaribacter marinus]
MTQAIAFKQLKKTMDSYSHLSDETWQTFQSFSKFRYVKKHSLIYQPGLIPDSFSFVVKGLVRAFAVGINGQEYNKNFFAENTFPGSMTALLTSSPSLLGFESLEQTVLIEIDFRRFRHLLFQKSDLMAFQIQYLEKNWLLHKDAREIKLVQDEATARYMQFKVEHPELLERIPLYHVASHLGITPTQLSRIRKSLAK